MVANSSPDEPHSSTERDPPGALHYGRAFADALHARLRSHFDSLGDASKREAPLTIGLFGGWGSGKTRHLHHLRDRVQSQVVTGEGAITLPVLFNAWRHEAEDHLVVPLLKTTHYALENWLKDQLSAVDKFDDVAKASLRASAIQLKDAALALAAGLKGKLSLPLLGEIEIDAGAMLAEDARRQAARKPKPAVARWFKKNLDRDLPATRLDRLDAIYHDFETHMRQLTGAGAGGGGKGTRLNLLFLIDDLDRCLPEKAVQMLESIKLFLDVPGCAFVLALDDEIVERGIAHRYRDYRQDDPAFDSIAHSLHPARWESFRARHGNASANPVSGFEYLEKMVQLPVQVPRPAAAEVHSYLQRFYPALFAELPPQPQPDPHDKGAPARDRNAAENAARGQLLKLIERAVPANPRKLNRVAELYGFWLNVAAENRWSIQQPAHRLTLLRLAILQLLAPDLYRFGQHQTAFLAKLESWLRDEPQARVQGALERRLKELRNGFEQQQSAVDLRQLERLDEPLLARLRTAQNHRSQFDPFDLLDPASPCEPLPAYYRLGLEPAAVAAAATAVAMGAARVMGVAGTAATTAIPAGMPTGIPARTAAGMPPRPIAVLAQREPFVDQLLSADPLAWRTALEQEATALDGHVLDDVSFQALLDGITGKPEHVTLAWLEPLAPHLTTAQLLALYRAGKLLTRLNAAIPNASPEPPP